MIILLYPDRDIRKNNQSFLFHMTLYHKRWVYLSHFKSMFVCFVGFTPAEQAVLVEMLVASVRQASEGPALAGRAGAKKVSVWHSADDTSATDNSPLTWWQQSI